MKFYDLNDDGTKKQLVDRLYNNWEEIREHELLKEQLPEVPSKLEILEEAKKEVKRLGRKKRIHPKTCEACINKMNRLKDFWKKSLAAEKDLQNFLEKVSK